VASNKVTAKRSVDPGLKQDFAAPRADRTLAAAYSQTALSDWVKRANR